VSSLAVSETLNKVPVVAMDFVLAERSILEKAKKWTGEHKPSIIKPKGEEAENG
jgi:hypothetical protein